MNENLSPGSSCVPAGKFFEEIFRQTALVSRRDIDSFHATESQIDPSISAIVS